MISVIVCTHNRAQSLQKTLESLGDMGIPATLAWELLVVDNNSCDHTREVVEAFTGTSRCPVRYIFERTQGLSQARNTGVRAARGEIIAFTDDDCIVDKYWLSRILHTFLSNPSFSVIGGRVELYNPCDKPVSIRTSKTSLILSSFREISERIIGCNMSYVRNVFDEIGYFDIRFGVGTHIPSAEDWDFLYRAYKKGLRIFYAPDILVYHNHGRRSDYQINLLNKGYIIGRWAFYCKYIMKCDLYIARMAYGEIRSIIIGIAKSIYTGETLDKHRKYIVAVLLGIMYWLGSPGSLRK